MDKKIYSTYEAAKILHAHHTTIIKWIKDNKLKAFLTPGGHRRIKKEDLEKFVDEYKIPIISDSINRTKKVLIVDDDPVLLFELKECLSNNGFEIDFASDGFKAGRKIYNNMPDLILLDFKMPGLDGFDICRILKNEKATTHISIFAITGLSTKADIDKINACGVKEYIKKPVDIEELLIKIKKELKL